MPLPLPLTPPRLALAELVELPLPTLPTGYLYEHDVEMKMILNGKCDGEFLFFFCWCVRE